MSRSLVCPSCNQPNAADAVQCRWCGELLARPVAPGRSIDPLCPSCSRPNPANAVQCGWCGELLAHPVAPVAAPPAPAPEPETEPVPASVAAMRAPRDWNISDAYWLQPMSVLQVLDGSFKLYRENFALFLAIMSVAYVPLAFVGMGFIWALLSATPQGGALGAGQPPTALIGIFCGSAVMLLLIHGIAVPIATGALTQAVSNRYLSRPATIRTSYRAVWSNFWPFLLTMIVANTIIAFSCIAAPVLTTFFGFICQIAILERTTGTAAMGRNIRLSEGHRWRVFGLAAIMFCVTLVTTWINALTCQLTLNPLIASEWARTLLEQGVNQILQMLLQPLWSVAWVLMYYDVRIRKEALDLEMLMMRA